MAGSVPLLAVRSKEGELDAIIESNESAGRIQIMIQILNNASPTGRVGKKITKAGQKLAMAGRPVWVDTRWLSIENNFGLSRESALEHFDRAIEEKLGETSDLFGIPPLVPVISNPADSSQLRGVRMLLEHHERPVAVRITAGAELPQSIETVLNELRLGPQRLHIVCDEGYVHAMDQCRVDLLNRALNRLAEYEVASISLLSGSTPDKRKTYETSVRERVELELWCAVREGCDIALSYGDYGVVHPIPPKHNGFGKPNPYIDYTVPDSTLFIARRIPGRGRSGPRAGESERYFYEVVDELADHPEFAGPEFSWGDKMLNSCCFQPKIGKRKPSVSVGSVTKWIALATSHHMVHISRGLDLRTGAGSMGE